MAGPKICVLLRQLFLITVLGQVFTESKHVNLMPPSTTELLFGSLNNNILPRADAENLDYRLPNTTVPIHYDVTLSTNVHTGERGFSGTVAIDLTVAESTNKIVLHARQLEKFEATIRRRDTATSVTYPLTWEFENTREFLTLTPEDAAINFPKDSNWTLTINYSGTLRTDNGGFYLSTYTDEKGVVHYLATTQFESTNARHAFPCYDEPAKRATFGFTIKHSDTYTAISNMPVDLAKSSRGTTVFEVTPRMSSYLLAIIVSDFEYSEGSLNGLPQRVFTRKGTRSQQQFSLVAGMLVESSLAQYFGVPFALPKLDQAAIPDFAAGAMENWGLATYREQYMLYTRENSTANAQVNIANIIGHEYTHMWFGDLVSVKWWTYLWLKEGFATLFSYESDDITYPEWNIYQLFHVSDYNSALINDGVISSTPMTHYVQTPSEISARYNTFSYAKPASVLYMFKNAWTDKVFRLGLHKYLTKHQYNSCDEWDLFESIQDAANEEKYSLPAGVATIFSSWTHQGGYPLLTVKRNYGTGGFTVTQSQYTNDNTYVSEKVWYVPFNFVVASNPDFRDTSASHYLQNVRELDVSNAQISSNDWLLLNKQSTGYYRINYDNENWRLIAAGLRNNTHQIHPRNRAQLMYDAYRLMISKRLDHSILLDLMSYLSNEDQYAPWTVANSIFSGLEEYFRGDPEYDHFRYFVIGLVDEIFGKIGVHDNSAETPLVKYLRNTLINLACLVGSDNCYRLTNNKLKEFINDKKRIEPNVETQIFCNGLRRASDAEFNYIFNALMESSVQADRNLYRSSLGCSRTANQIKQFVESSTDSSNKLQSSERTSVLSSAYTRGEIGLTASLEFLEKNWEPYGKLGTENSKPLDSALRGMAQYVVSDRQKDRILALVGTVENSVYVTETLRSAVQNSIDNNFNWLQTNRNPLLNWIVTYRTGGGAALTVSCLTLIVSLLTILHGLL